MPSPQSENTKLWWELKEALRDKAVAQNGRKELSQTVNSLTLQLKETQAQRVKAVNDLVEVRAAADAFRSKVQLQQCEQEDAKALLIRNTTLEQELAAAQVHSRLSIEGGSTPVGGQGRSGSEAQEILLPSAGPGPALRKSL